MDFFVDHAVAFALVCAAVAVLYGLYLTWWLLQDPTTAALATVRAAVDPTATGGQYYGPDGRNEWTGHPIQDRSSERSYDTEAQARLWELSEQETGVSYPLGHSPVDGPGTMVPGP